MFGAGVEDRNNLPRRHHTKPFVYVERPANVGDLAHARRVASDNICDAPPARRNPQRAVLLEGVLIGPKEHEAPGQVALALFGRLAEPAVRSVVRCHRRVPPAFVGRPKAQRRHESKVLACRNARRDVVHALNVARGRQPPLRGKRASGVARRRGDRQRNSDIVEKEHSCSADSSLSSQAVSPTTSPWRGAGSPPLVERAQHLEVLLRYCRGHSGIALYGSARSADA